MATTKKIQTHNLALEMVYQDGQTYKLKGKPRIRYYADEGRVTVEGYGTLSLESPYGVTTHLVCQNEGARRLIGPHGDTRTHSKMQGVRKRIRALLHHAGDSFSEMQA